MPTSPDDYDVAAAAWAVADADGEVADMAAWAAKSTDPFLLKLARQYQYEGWLSEKQLAIIRREFALATRAGDEGVGDPDPPSDYDLY